MDKLATLAEALDRIGAFGDAPALMAVREDRAETWSFATLADKAARLAAGLSARRIGPGTTVALVGPSSPAWVASFLAVASAGATALPLDPELGGAELNRMMKESGCSLAFVDTGSFTAQIDGPMPQFVRLNESDDSSAIPPWTTLLDRAAESRPKVGENDTALLVYTSGTTGTPKAVELSHTNIAANLNALFTQNLVAAGDRVLLPLPLFHVYPLVVGLLTALLSGASVIFPGGISGPQLAAALREGRATHIVGVPRLYTALVAAIQARVTAQGRIAQTLFAAMLSVSVALRRWFGLRIGRRLFRSLHARLAPDLRLLVSGGAALDPATERMLDGLGWEVLTGYGLTETAPILAFNRRGQARIGSAGQALPGISLRIADPDANGVGEVQAKGPSIFKSYRNDPATSAAAFTPDDWFRTGDLGRLDADGFLYLVARAKETIVLPGGKKIFPETLEKIYARAPLIREIAVLLDHGALVALVVPEPEALRGADRIEDNIRFALTEIAQTLPSYQRVTGFAISRDALPRTRMGKIRRHLLGARYAQARAGRQAAAPAPLSPDDRALLEQPVAARIWSWLAARYPDVPLSPDTHLQLDLGIDSLAWLELTLDLESAQGVALDERTLDDITTVRDLLQAAIAARPPRSQAALTPQEARWIAPLPVWARALRAILIAVNRIGVRLLFRLRCNGAQALPTRGPCIICPNHESFLDPFVLAAALPGSVLAQTYWAGWTGLLFSSGWRRVFSRVGRVLPIDPGRPGASLALAREVLKRGGILVWFPEGARSRDGNLQRFLPGIGMLVRESAAPAAPVLIQGTFAAWPSHRRLPRPRPVSITIGAPIPSAELLAGQASSETVADRLRAAVMALGGDTGGPGGPANGRKRP